MRQWYCIYTKPKQSDIVCKKLGKLPEIETFNPKFKRKKFLKGKWMDVIEDLFPCYIFAKLELNKYYRIVKYTRGVRRFVGDILGKPYIIEEYIIDSIKNRIKDGFVILESYKFKSGDKVIIKDGPLEGWEGIFLEELKPKDRVLILLNAIQYQAKVEMDKSFIRKQL